MAVTEAYLRACNPDTPAAELCSLALEVQDTAMRERLAENPNAPLVLLMTLANDPDPEVRCAVAGNRAAPFCVLSKLVSDPDPTVRFTLAEDMHLPVSLLKKLAADQNPYVMVRAERTLAALELELSVADAGFSFEPKETHKLGSLLARAGLVKAEKISELLAQAQATNTPLGRLLVTHGVLPAPVISRALVCVGKFQRGQRSVS